MGILIKELRIRNYKCYESLDVELNETSLLLGANNAGKTSLLEALELSFTRYKRISEELIFIKKDEVLNKDKEIIIDVLILPNEESFDEEWFNLFGKLIFEDDEKDRIALRTIIKYNQIKGEYDLEHKAMTEWPDSNDVLTFNDYNNQRVTSNILEAIPVFYLDAKRDITTEMGDKYSYWGKLVKDINLLPEDVEEIEKALNDINNDLVKNSEVLEHLSSSLNKITDVVDSEKRSVEINPVSRKIRDLNKGMEIRFNDKDSESFSIANQGMGTRSWATFLTLSAYIDWKLLEMKREEKPFHPLLLLEEPEAHLHPQAQRKIYSQMQKLVGQKLISTHSSIIAAQADLSSIIHVYKNGCSSSINNIAIEKLKSEEIRKIKEEVLKTRGDVLFADTLILCEGETEDQVLPIFFKEFFENEPFELGVNIISVGGFGNYKPFMTVARDLDIDVFILSDGERNVIKAVEKAFSNIFEGIENYKVDERVKFLPDHADFEKYLLKDGYRQEIVETIDEINETKNFINTYIEKQQSSRGKRVETADTCQTCHQHIYSEQTMDYSGEEGFDKALLDWLSKNKTEYSSLIGNKILERKGADNIPTEIRNLFSQIASIKKYEISKKYRVFDIEEVEQ